MNYLQKPLVWLESAYEKIWLRLDRPGTVRLALFLVPLAFGMLSLAYGQDDNWDLHNYHIYNPYAFLNGKIGFDLAPAQWQSYFNPALDLLYYGLTRAMPAPLVGFVMGLLQGLNFVLVLGLVRAVLARSAVDAPSPRLALLLAMAGCLGAGFLSELGNTMGDNMTSLCVLGALYMLLSQFQRLGNGGARSVMIAALAGLVMGLGAGLKLTNAVYALALCLTLLSIPGSVVQRVRLAFVFGVGVLAGIAASAGFWFWKMWQVFGNPLFPQFNDRFHGPMASAIGVGDNGWLPKGWGEKIFWPFIFTLHPNRVIEIPLTQLIWPMLYIGLIVFALQRLRAGILARPMVPPIPQNTRFLLIFFSLSYIVWLNLFGIYRYLIPLELLAPLAFWIVIGGMMPIAIARGVAGYGLLLAALVIFPFSNWGHASWSRNSFTADVPVLQQPEQNMVFTVHGDPAMGWVVPFFPRTLAFVALRSGFPESQAYRARVDAMMASRSGPFYVMLQADRNDPANIGSDAERHQANEWNHAVLDKADNVLAHYDLTLNAESCITYAAFIGKSRWPYQLCTVARR